MHDAAKSTHIGQPVRRKEDQRLVTGKGKYSDDYCVPGQAHAVFLRSPHAHAMIKSIDVKAALEVPGVIMVLTGADRLADGLKPLPHNPMSTHKAETPLENSDGTPPFTAPHYPLAHDRARYVGEAVAIVIAESVAAAKDGADAVEIDYEVLPAVTATLAAAAPDAPKVWDNAKSNVGLDAVVGDRAATDAAFKRAKHVVKFETWAQRVTGVTMEPRAAVGAYDRESGRYTVYAGSGGAVKLKQDIAAVLDVPADKVRVLMDDVGGNFGTRGEVYPEFAVLAWAARRAGRPVKWTSERQESFLSDYQGRDLAVSAELALDADGNFLAMRGSNVSNAGAHTVSYAPLKKGLGIMSSIYRMPAVFFRARVTLSNTMMTRPYRSAGRPEVMYVMERLIDIAAFECGFDRVELRRRNLLTEAELPYTNPFHMTYDNGDYHGAMDAALKLGDWAGFAQRRDEAKKRGRLRGIGLANYVDTSTGAPRERTDITVRADGTVEVVIGIVSQGQGHETAYAQLAGDWLGVPVESVQLITGDTDIVKVGGGAHGGRGMRMASLVIWNATREIIKKGTRIAARMLECDPSMLKFVGGRFEQDGSEKSVGLFEVTKAAQTLADLPEDLRGPLAATCDQVHHEASFPYGTHVCEVEVDPETGSVQIVNYAAVDDVGRAINPLLIHGQVHGGIAQGAGQALYEQCFYDAASGQLLSGSLMDYALPRADTLPFFKTEISEVPSNTHPLGIRPAGESGTTPALGVVINAVVDALSEFGVKHVEMPATPERIWRAIHGMAPPASPNNR